MLCSIRNQSTNYKQFTKLIIWHCSKWKQMGWIYSFHRQNEEERKKREWSVNLKYFFGVHCRKNWNEDIIIIQKRVCVCVEFLSRLFTLFVSSSTLRIDFNGLKYVEKPHHFMNKTITNSWIVYHTYQMGELFWMKRREKPQNSTAHTK